MGTQTTSELVVTLSGDETSRHKHDEVLELRISAGGKETLVHLRPRSLVCFIQGFIDGGGLLDPHSAGRILDQHWNFYRYGLLVRTEVAEYHRLVNIESLVEVLKSLPPATVGEFRPPVWLQGDVG